MTSRSKRGAPSGSKRSHHTGNPNGSTIHGARKAYAAVLPGIRVDDPSRVLHIIDSLSSERMPDARLMAAEMATEIATKAPISGERKIELLGRAKELLTTISNADEHFNANTVIGIKAKVNLAALPAIATLAIEERLPSPAVIAKTYGELGQLAEQTVQRSRELKTSGQREKAARLNGITGELAINLLLLRFQIKELGGKGEIALPSFFSEDNLGLFGAGNTHSDKWDLSVFSDTSGPPELLHAIQVKTADPHQVERTGRGSLKPTVDGIVYLCVREDLATTSRERQGMGSPILSIVGCVQHELDGTAKPSETERLDSRTELLLDILDEQSDASQVAY